MEQRLAEVEKDRDGAEHSLSNMRKQIEQPHKASRCLQMAIEVEQERK